MRGVIAHIIAEVLDLWSLVLVDWDLVDIAPNVVGINGWDLKSQPLNIKNE